MDSPDFHLRLRLHLTDKENFQKAIEDVNKVLSKGTEEGLIFRIQLDSYTREIERYGGELIEDCETLFYKDSLTLTKALVSDLRSEIDSIIFGVVAMERYFNMLDFSIKDRIEFSERMIKAYSREHGITQPVNINKMIRKYKNLIFDRIDKSCVDKSLFIHDDYARIRNSVIKHELITSLIHMSMNRIFVNNQRVYEMICYIALQKYYDKLKHISAASDSPK